VLPLPGMKQKAGSIGPGTGTQLLPQLVHTEREGVVAVHEMGPFSC
jgi:hypothetical protein